MSQYIIDKSLSRHVLMAGNYYKNHHPGGISAVVDYWSQYIEGLQYYPTFKESNELVKRGWFVVSYARLWARMLTDKDAQIVHIHAAADGSFWRKAKIVNLAKKMCRKVVLHIHASRFKDFYAEATGEKKQWIVDTLKKADVLICLSESWRQWFEGVGVVPEKIVVLHNITSFPQVEGQKAKVERLKEADGLNRPVRFLFMGEIGQRKGVFDIIRGLAAHKDELLGKLELRIGGNKNEDKLMKAIKDGGLEQVVTFEGWVSGDKKIELLNWADVYILPSFNEGLPISILEAMSYSMPIISTPVGGIPEVVTSSANGEGQKANGVLVTPGNDEKIFAAMKKYWHQPELIESEGKESYKRAETYLPDYVLNHLKEIYQGLVG